MAVGSLQHTYQKKKKNFIVVTQKICGCYVNSRTKLHLRTSVSYLLSCSDETGHPVFNFCFFFNIFKLFWYYDIKNKFFKKNI